MSRLPTRRHPTAHLIFGFLLVTLFVPVSQALDIVIDLDSTLIFLPPREGDSRIVAMGKEYGVAPGAGALIQSLARLPDVRISFFSAYPLAKRNNEALDALKLPDGRTARELSFKILHGTRAQRASKSADPAALQPEAQIFWGDIKKDLRLVALDLDLNETILIDDTHTNVIRGQERSLLWVHNHSADGEMARVRGLIDAALRLADTEQISTVDALWKLQWERGDEGLQYLSRSANAPTLYSAGQRQLHKEEAQLVLARDLLKSLRQNCEIQEQPRAEAAYLKKVLSGGL